MSYQQYLYTPSNKTQPQQQQQQQQARNVAYSTDNTTTTVPSAPWHHLQYRAPVPVPTLPTVLTVQHQPSLWTTQTTMPTHHHRTEATSPSTPVNPGAPAPAQLQNVSSPLLLKTGGTPPPATKTEQEEMFYFSIPKGLMNRPKVRTLLGATVEDDELQTDNHTVKMEAPSSTAANDSATVEEAPTLDVQTSSMPILDPSIVPEGEGLING